MITETTPMTLEAQLLENLPYAHRAAYRIAGGHDWEDLVQEAFIRIMKASPSVEHDYGYIHKGYISRSVKSVYLDKIKKKQIQAVSIMEDVHTASMPSHEGIMELQAEIAEIRTIMTDEEWSIFTLIAEGYTGTEIAEKIGTNPTRVKTIIRRARRKLKTIN